MDTSGFDQNFDFQAQLAADEAAVAQERDALGLSADALVSSLSPSKLRHQSPRSNNVCPVVAAGKTGCRFLLHRHIVYLPPLSHTHTPERSPRAPTLGRAPMRWAGSAPRRRPPRSATPRTQPKHQAPVAPTLPTVSPSILPSPTCCQPSSLLNRLPSLPLNSL